MTAPRLGGGALIAVIRIALAPCAAIGFAACDILGAPGMRVESWTPGEGRFARGDDLSVSVLFSSEPDRVSAENAFSMSEDGANLAGSFSWDGRRLRFAPFSELVEGAVYRVSVSADAKTPDGVSLVEALDGRFTTKAEDERPSVVSTIPASGGALSEPTDRVAVTFSETVDPVSFRGRLSLSPSIFGVWSLGGGGTTAVFTPLEPWDWGVEYLCSVSADLTDLSLNRMGEDYSFRFAVGDDTDAPALVGADALDVAGGVAAAVVPDDPASGEAAENLGWEAAWRLKLRFSEPVALKTLETRVSAEGGPSMSLETRGEASDAAVFRFDERPAFGSRFIVRLRAGVEDVRGNATEEDVTLRMTADGAGSKPPRLVGIRIPMSPGEASPADRNLAAFAVDAPYSTLFLDGAATAYPIGLSTPSSVELYFELAQGASLDPLSIMSCFGVSATNGALDFSARRVALSGIADQAHHAPWAGYAVARVDGAFTNRVDSGVVTFALASGFKDSAGNAADAAQALPLLK